MKKYSYVGVSFIILIFGIYTVPKIIDYLSGEQLYTFPEVPYFEFTNQRGELITNKSYKGKVYVVEFFFTTCPTICPLMNEKMVTLQNEFFGNPYFGIASISINPEHDTTQILKEYAEEFKISSPHWHLLSGQPREKVYELAHKGFKLYAGVAEEEVGGFEHSGLFALIDKNGFIRSRPDKNGNPIMYYRALRENEFPDQINELKEDIKILLKE